MDWPHSMSVYGSQRPLHDAGMEDNEDEDFYGYGLNANAANGTAHAMPGAPDSVGSLNHHKEVTLTSTE